jgi:peroxiredoxin
MMRVFPGSGVVRRVARRRAPALAIGLMVLGSACSGSTRSGEAKAAPALVGQTIEGRSWSLADQRPHWVVVAFQAEWCAPCRAEVSELKSLMAQRPDVRVVSVGFASTDEESRKFASSTGLQWPMIADPTGERSEDWKVLSLPSTVIVDPHGDVAARMVGGLTAKRVITLVDAQSEVPA